MCVAGRRRSRPGAARISRPRARTQGRGARASRPAARRPRPGRRRNSASIGRASASSGRRRRRSRRARRRSAIGRVIVLGVAPRPPSPPRALTRPRAISAVDAGRPRPGRRARTPPTCAPPRGAPESTQNHSSATTSRSAAAASPESPSQRSAGDHVVALGLAGGGTSAPARAPRSSGSARSASAANQRACASRDGLELARLLELLEPVLADRLEHPVAGRLAPGTTCSSERSASAASAVEHVRLARARLGATATALSAVAPGAEDRQPAGERALGLVEQLPAPVDHGAQRAMARQRGAAAAGEQPEAVVEARGELLERHRAQPRGGELDAPAAARRAGGRSPRTARPCVVDREARPRGGRAVGEQLDGGMGERLGARARPGSASGGTGARLSPAIASGSRLVATIRRPRAVARAGARRARPRRRSGARSCRARGSSRGRRGRRAAARGRRAGGMRGARAAAASRSPSAPSTAGDDLDLGGDRRELDHPHAVGDARPPHGARPRAASRVLPAPPGPTSVTRRECAAAARRCARSRRSRPTKLVTGARRLLRRARRRRGRARRAGRPGARPAARARATAPSSSSSRARIALVGGERVGLAAGGEQRGDQPRGEPLVQRVLGEQPPRARRTSRSPRPSASSASARSASAPSAQVLEPRGGRDREAAGRRGRPAPGRATARAPRAASRPRAPDRRRAARPRRPPRAPRSGARRRVGATASR